MWIIGNGPSMSISFIKFRDTLFPLGLFSIPQVNLYFPDFNSDNLLYWQKKGYILKLRRGWYCFRDFINISEFNYLIANNIYAPSYISHQDALAYYGLIPEHIVHSISVTTKKTAIFSTPVRIFKYYSIHPRLFFGFELKEMMINGFKREFLIADREKAILDLLYLFDFYISESDLEEIRLNEAVLEKEVNWTRMDEYLSRFGLKMLDRKIQIIRKIHGL